MGPVIYIYLPTTLIFLRARNQYLEMLIGFFFMLILSDSRVYSLGFAKNAKEIYIIILALYLLTDRENFTPFNKFYTRFIPFFLIALACLLNAPTDNIFNSCEKITSYFFLLLVVPNYVQRAYLDKGKEFFKALIYFATLILLIGFVFKYLSPGIVTRESRYEGLFGNPNGLGLFSLLLFLLFSVVLEFFPDLFQRREKIVIYSAIILSVILSGSRGSLFGLIIFLSFSYFYKTSFFIGSSLAVIFLVSYNYITTHLPELITSFGLENYFRLNTLEDASGRFVAWRFTWQHIQESFWLGRGFEYTNYLFNIPEYVVSLQAAGHFGNIHNSYLTLWLDTGLIGLSAYIIAFVGYFIKALKKTKLALPLMFAAVFSSFYESWLTASLNPFTIILFIILSILTTDVIISSKAKAAVPIQ